MKAQRFILVAVVAVASCRLWTGTVECDTDSDCTGFGAEVCGSDRVCASTATSGRSDRDPPRNPPDSSTPCDEANAIIIAKQEACGVDLSGGEGEGEGEAECSNQDAADAQQFADCINVNGCKHVAGGGDDFDANSEEFTQFLECIE